MCLENTSISKPIADVANNLINKLSSCIAWFFTRETPEKIATDNYISDIKKLDLPILQKAALISNAGKVIKEYSNQRDVVTMAIDLLQGEAEPDKVDEDWLALFMDRVRLISNKEVQMIWASILAAECNKPNTKSKHLLNVLSLMGKEEAQIFERLSRFCVTNTSRTSYCPIIRGCLLDEYYKKYGLNFDDLLTLKSLGLIDISFTDSEGDYSIGFTLDESNDFVYGNDCFTFPEGIKNIRVGGVVFTKVGKELFSVFSPEPIEGFFSDICIPLWESLNGGKNN